jgi:hypothetical protein
MNYDDLYKLYSLFNKTARVRKIWFGSMIARRVFGKGMYYVSGSSSHCHSTVMPTDDRISLPNRLRRNVFVSCMQELLNFTRSMMDMNSTTKRLSYNVHDWIPHHREKDDYDVRYITSILTEWVGVLTCKMVIGSKQIVGTR